MPLLTTTIGSYPKPPHAPVPASFDGAWRSTADVVDRVLSERDREEIDRAVHEVVAEQVAIGIDVPTDGEIRREHYIYYHCRHLGGFDFDGLVPKVMRDGGWTDLVPVTSGPITAGAPFLTRDWRVPRRPPTDR